MKIISVNDPILDVEEFTNTMPKHASIVMVYMMDNCPYCENLKPTWETVKKILDNDNRFEDLLVADINSNASNQLPLPPVTGFPNIKILNDNKLTEYTGMREVDPLLKFIQKMVKKNKKHKHHNYPSHRKSPHSHHNYPKHRKSPRSIKRSAKKRSGKSHKRSTRRSTRRTTRRTRKSQK